MIKKSTYCLLLFVVFINTAGFAQDNIKGSIRAISKYDGKVVKIRWAPDNQFIWRSLNKSGYIIERYTVKESGQLVSGKPLKTILTQNPIKPWRDDEWEAHKDNKYVAIARETLKGSVSSTFGGSNSISQIAESTQIEKNSFGFALYSADVEPLAAEALGLSFYDKSITANSQYTYIIRPASVEEGYAIQHAVVSIVTDAPQIMPPIENIKVISGDKRMKIAVNVDLLQDFYSAYKIEKKEKLIHQFKELDQPMQVHLNPKSGQSSWMEIIDTLAANNVPVWYRIRGVDAFGDFGPYSEEITVEGRDLFDGKFAPNIDTLINRDNINILLEWSFEEAEIASSIEIQKAENIDGPYETLKLIHEPLTSGQLVDENPNMSNYYQIIATDASGKRAQSYPRFIQLQDLYPPAMPKGLSGKINKKNGALTLNWQGNTEKDLLGYRVFSANTIDGEWLELTKDVISVNSFTDTISLKSLTNDIYLKIQAMDQRFKLSDFSEILHLKKPDLIAPVAAQISNHKIEAETLSFDLIPSPSQDILAYHLIIETDETTDTLASWQPDKLPRHMTIDNFSCKKIKLVLTTGDESGNISTTEPMFFTMPCAVGKEEMKILAARLSDDSRSISLDWSAKVSKSGVEIVQWQLYRSINSGPWRTYQIFEASKRSYRDYLLKQSNRYKYKLKAECSDTRIELWTNEVDLKF